MLQAKKNYINVDYVLNRREDILFIEFIKFVSDKKSKRYSSNYIKTYKNIINHIVDFCEITDSVLYINSINEEFLEDFIVYLESKDLKQSYIIQILNLIKSLVKKAANYGYLVDPTYDDVFIRNDDDNFSVFLSMNEITRIYYYPNLTRKQKRIKDLFIVGCLTGLRYSDYSNLTKDNFIDGFIVKVTRKTKKKVIIPIHSYVEEILKEYDYDLPKNLTIQHFNRYVKLICRKVGIDDTIMYHYTKGGKIVSVKKKKWELISSHTARRSAATNMYLTKRMSTSDIMQITGHTTEKSFFRYIMTSNENKARNIAGDLYFRK